MKRIIHQFLLLSLFLFLFIELLFFVPKTLETNEAAVSPTNTTQEEDAGSNGQRMEGVHLVEGQGDKREGELFSSDAEGLIGQGVWNLKKVKVIFYARTGDFYKVIGDQGRIDTATKNIDIVGNVFTSSTNGYEVRTSELHYTSGEKILKLPASLVVRGPKDKAGYRLTVKSQSMITYLETSLMILDGNVIADRKMQSSAGLEKNVKIKSGMAHLSGKSNLVRFFNPVRVEYDHFEVNAPEAFFNYKENSDIPESILINGGVTVDGRNRKATTENLKIDVLQDQYILRGSPKVLQNGDEIVGEEIIFLNGGNKVRVEKARAFVEEVGGKTSE
jgi:lipopolysaccharide export system protein LptA